MDPVSIIGIAGTVFSIIDKIGKGIILLRSLQSRFRNANLTASLVISHLSTVKAAMNQISNWINSDLNASKHQQLIEDLTLSLEGCLLLVVLLNTRLEELSKDDDQRLSTTGKIGMMLEESEMKEYLGFLNHHISALTLLLTAIQCPSTFEQNNILSSGESRRIMSLVKEDTSSLRVIGDTDSFHTERSASTRNSRLIDSTFDFDREVFTSKAYRSALRSNMVQNLKRSLRPNSTHEGFVPSARSVAPQSIAETDAEDVNESLQNANARPISFLTIDNIEPFYNGQIMEDSEEEESDAASHSNTISRPIATDRMSVISELSEDSSKNSETKPLVVNKDNDLRSTIKISVTRKTVVERLRNFRSIPVLSNRRSMSLSSNKYLSTHETQLLRSELEPKIVIIGASSSGKTTLAKSLDILGSKGTQIGLNSTFILGQWRDTILLNLYFNIDVIMDSMEESDQMKSTSLMKPEISMLRVRPWRALDPKPEMVRVIEKFWKDDKVQRAYWQLCSSNLLLDNAAYLFDSIKRIGLSYRYTPSARDIMWTSERTIGTSKTSFVTETKTYDVYDMGGSRFERKKWMQTQHRMHEVGNASTAVLVADVTGYHKTLAEDGEGPETNYMSESLQLFDSLSCSTWFSRSGIILLFTKHDQLGSALLSAPLKDHFPDYEGGDSESEATKFITEKFVGLIPKDRRPVCVGFASIASDPMSMAKVVSNGIDHYKNRGHHSCDYFLLSSDGISRTAVYLQSQITEVEETEFDDNEKGIASPAGSSQFIPQKYFLPS